ncbi:MAG: nucleoside-diphosphate kinase [Bacteroidales bacterium]|nr:nucleoside-diphosphate kinase [Bacteroidales bacterium]MCF8327913.1 nucleoside-diphosphate kinase [Bacteroidales bacterium]
MENTTTLTIIKPKSIEKGFHGAILNDIIEHGFKIKALKLIQMTKSQAEKFYEIHRDKPFYDDLTSFMSSSPVIVAILEAPDAVKSFREFIGATNPDKAEEGTIREKFGSSITKNAVHGSDSDENAAKEADFFFSELERFNY